MNAAILSITGYPKEDEWLGVDGNAYQPCERVTLKYEPGQKAPFDVVFTLATQPLPDKAK